MSVSYENEPHLFWKMCWDTDTATWHWGRVHDKLVQYEQKLLQGKSNQRVFVPLCGKSVDLKWLYNKGHTVIGVELVEKPVINFFLEQKLSYRVSVCPRTGCKIYKVEDGRLQVYVSDLFSLTPEVLGTFDAVWDRGSLVALLPEDRSRYAPFVRSLLRINGRVLVESAEYQIKGFNGPPKNIPVPEIQNIYRGLCSVELLATEDHTGSRRAINDWFLVHYLLLQPVTRAETQ